MPHQSIYCYGEMLWDLLPQGKQAGGAPANVATHLQQLGVSAYVISSLGGDELGREIRRYFEERGLGLPYVQTHPSAATGRVLVDLTDPTAVRYDILKPVAWDEIRFNPAVAERLQGNTLVFGSLSARSETSRATLRRYIQWATHRVLDINLRPPHYNKSILEELLTAADTLKLNEEELPQLLPAGLQTATPEEQLTWLRQTYGLQRCLLTLGADGACCLDDTGFFQHAGFRVKVADSIGSGDAFLAGFLASRSQGLSAEEALLFASAVGALVASCAGATPRISAAQIRTFMAEREAPKDKATPSGE